MSLPDTFRRPDVRADGLCAAPAHRWCLMGHVVAILLLLGISSLAAEAARPVSEAADWAISHVQIEPPAFNPTAGQSIKIHYHLSASADVTLTIYGPNRELLRELIADVPRAAGHNAEEWGGRDVAGVTVPDEAYFFIITTQAGKRKTVYDPRRHCGGECVIPKDCKWVPENQVVNYVLPKASRVILRSGGRLSGGPLLRTLVNWEPRPRGACSEPWDGLDSDGVRKMAPNDNGGISIAAFALPGNSIITTGNCKLTYRDYYLNKGRFRFHTPTVPRAERPRHGLTSPYSVIPVHLHKDIAISLNVVPLVGDGAVTGSSHGASSQPAGTQPSSGKSASKLPAVSLSGDRALLRIDIPDRTERMFMTNQRFDLVVYVDNRLIIEAEYGHVPIDWEWDLGGLEPGKHVLTANLAGFRGNLGTASRLVEIVQGPK